MTHETNSTKNASAPKMNVVFFQQETLFLTKQWLTRGLVTTGAIGHAIKHFITHVGEFVGSLPQPNKINCATVPNTRYSFLSLAPKKVQYCLSMN